MTEIRVVEVLAALSLTTDLASGLPFEKGLRTCCVADEFAQVLGLAPHERAAVFHAALLRAVGCTAHAPENAQMFEDDTAFSAALKALDFGDAEVFGRQLSTFGAWAGPDKAPRLAEVLVAAAPTVGPHAAQFGCEVSRALGSRIGLAAEVVAALDDVYERWDGLGIPAGKTGEALTLAGRIVHIAEQAVLAFYATGLDGAAQEVSRRAGGHLDPVLAGRFAAASAVVLAPLAAPDALAEVLRREPQPHTTVTPGGLVRLCEALAVFADLKSIHMLGHSHHVAALSVAAAKAAGLPQDEVVALHAAALVHNVGSAVVPSSLLDKAGALTSVELERVALQTYWTERILVRCPALAFLAPMAIAASTHHADSAASGYAAVAGAWRPRPQGVGAGILLAAEAFAALTEPRPGRPQLDRAAAQEALCRAARDGHLDLDAARWVTDSEPPAPAKAKPPRGLTPREVEVLALAARGLRNRDIARELFVSERTVGHHLAHIYDKTGVRTRAGVAVFAIENGLVGAGSRSR